MVGLAKLGWNKYTVACLNKLDRCSLPKEPGNKH